jgi:hypothetical protein
MDLIKFKSSFFKDILGKQRLEKIFTVHISSTYLPLCISNQELLKFNDKEMNVSTKSGQTSLTKTSQEKFYE